MTRRIDIVEVGPRDGLQSIQTIFSTEGKMEWIRREAAAGREAAARPAAAARGRRRGGAPRLLGRRARAQGGRGRDEVFGDEDDVRLIYLCFTNNSHTRYATQATA